MSEKKCTFQKTVKEKGGFLQEWDSFIICGLTRAGRFADYYCLCNPEICPIYQIWKRETK